MDSTDSSQLEVNTRKLLKRFQDDFQEAAKTGLCGEKLFATLRAAASLLRGDVQEIESLNSLVKLQCRRCPNLSLELLSARICIKKSLKFDSDNTGKEAAIRSKWTNVRDVCYAVLQRCQSSGEVFKELLLDSLRWSPPLRDSDPAALVVVDLVSLDPSLKPTGATLWATPYNLKWQKAYKALIKETQALTAVLSFSIAVPSASSASSSSSRPPGPADPNDWCIVCFDFGHTEPASVLELCLLSKSLCRSF